MNDDVMERLRATVKPWAAGTYMPESIMDIKKALERIETLEHENNGLRGVNHQLADAHAFATDPASSNWQGNTIRTMHNRVVTLEAALREIVDHIDIGQVGSARKTDIARRALEGK